MTERVRVLVVDDSEFFGTLVAGELEDQYGMETRRTDNAEDALRYLEAGEFDCIVSDYDMPEMNGIEFFERVRNQGYDIPFFLLTAAGSEEVASEAITAGVSDYFPKTKGEDQFEILGKRIENIVSQRRAQRSLERQRRLHETLWDITQDLLHAPTPTEIANSVCDGLAAVDRFHLAWMDPGNTESGARAIGGGSVSELQDVLEAVDTTVPQSPTEQALTQQTVASATVETGLTDGETEILAIPLLHRGNSYGAVMVAADAGSISASDRESLNHVGTTVGHALAAVEMQREVEIFREAVEQADPAILITDAAGTIEYANPAFAEITGYETDAVVGEPVSLLATDEFDEQYYAGLWERVRRGRPVRDEAVQRRKDGAQFHADLSVAPINVDGGESSKFVLIESDITGLKSREQRLQVLNRVIRHNLRNDLNAAQGYLSLVVEKLEDDELRSHAKRVQQTVDELMTVGEKAHFVNKMVDATDDSAQATVVDLADVVDDEVTPVRADYPDATITTDIEAGLQTRGSHLHAAIHELLVNAIEHNDSDRPQVSVTATTEGTPEGICYVEVADDGPGIPELEQNTLARGQETDLAHGSSLGLWLVRWIVTHVGGDLDIEESETGGTLVRLSLPRADDSRND